MTDSYDRFWYYLDEKATQPTKRGPYMRQEMTSLLASKTIDDTTFVWHPCIGNWLIASHAAPLYRPIRGPTFPLIP